MFLVVVAILSIVLAFADSPLALLRDQRLVLAAVAGATILPGALAAAAAMRAKRLFEAHPDDPRRGQNWMADAGEWIQYSLGAMHAAVLCLTDWMGMCGRVPVVGDWPAVPGLLAATPFLISILLVWTALYPAERAARQIALEISLFRGQPVRPVWSLREYLLFTFRHQVLFILVPMTVILIVRDLLQVYVPNQNVRDPLLGAAAAIVAVVTPVVLRYVWVTRPLAAGALRDRLERLAGKLRMRCRDILVWDTDGMVANAAVAGVVPFLRYVLLSDALLERMDESQIEAVFGHESGHVKKHHITYILLFSLISGSFLTAVTQVTHDWPHREFQIAMGVVGLLILGKWSAGFCWISWQFERQADIFGARALTMAGLPCASPCVIHHPELLAGREAGGAADTSIPHPDSASNGRGGLRDGATASASISLPPALAMNMLPHGRERGAGESVEEPLCFTAASVFADTLHDVARLNGVSPDAGSWRHPSISSRSRSLQMLALDPRAAFRFERRVRRIKAVIFVAAALSALWAGYELRVWTMLGVAWPT